MSTLDVTAYTSVRNRVYQRWRELKSGSLPTCPPLDARSPTQRAALHPFLMMSVSSIATSSAAAAQLATSSTSRPRSHSRSRSGALGLSEGQTHAPVAQAPIPTVSGPSPSPSPAPPPALGGVGLVSNPVSATASDSLSTDSDTRTGSRELIPAENSATGLAEAPVPPVAVTSASGQERINSPAVHLGGTATAEAVESAPDSASKTEDTVMATDEAVSPRQEDAAEPEPSAATQVSGGLKGRRRRPQNLNLSATKSVPGTIRTPKDLAQDIAVQCLSPTLPRGLSVEMLKRSREIEAQQRQLIASRELSGNLRRSRHTTEDQSDSAGTSRVTSPHTTNTELNDASTRSNPLSVSEDRLEAAQLSQAPVQGSKAPLDALIDAANSASEKLPASGPIHVEAAPGLNVIPPHSAESAPGSSASSATSSHFPTPVNGNRGPSLATRRGGRQVELDLNLLSQDRAATGPSALPYTEPDVGRAARKRLMVDEEDEYAEQRALDDDDEPVRPTQRMRSVHGPHIPPMYAMAPPMPAFEPAMAGIPLGDKKVRFMQLCSEMWDLLQS